MGIWTITAGISAIIAGHISELINIQSSMSIQKIDSIFLIKFLWLGIIVTTVGLLAFIFLRKPIKGLIGN
jgi:cell division protein FtsX